MHIFIGFQQDRYRSIALDETYRLAPNLPESGTCEESFRVMKLMIPKFEARSMVVGVPGKRIGKVQNRHIELIKNIAEMYKDRGELYKSEGNLE